MKSWTKGDRVAQATYGNGTLVEASPGKNPEIFYGAIGGYGGLGVIVEATLALADDVRVERRSVIMPVDAYRRFFNENIRGNSDVIFHNADIYPGAFDTLRPSSVPEQVPLASYLTLRGCTLSVAGGSNVSVPSREHEPAKLSSRSRDSAGLTSCFR